MRITRVFIDTPLEGHQYLNLPPNISHYVTRVLRIKPQQIIHLFNGQGGYWIGKVESCSTKKVTVLLSTHCPQNNVSPLKIHLGQCLGRSQKMDYIIQKATELGVNQITPLLSNRSEIKYTEEKIAQKLQHWRQISISASEQCGRNCIPTIEPPMPLTTWLIHNQADLALCMHPSATKNIPTQNIQPETVSVLIGPEGGLTPDEVQEAVHKNNIPISLGPRILRTETAPVAVISVLQYLWGDWSL